jgi:hypothetical protein
MGQVGAKARSGYCGPALSGAQAALRKQAGENPSAFEGLVGAKLISWFCR